MGMWSMPIRRVARAGGVIAAPVTEKRLRLNNGASSSKLMRGLSNIDFKEKREMLPEIYKVNEGNVFIPLG
jgi:hypothetical protein